MTALHIVLSLLRGSNARYARVPRMDNNNTHNRGAHNKLLECMRRATSSSASRCSYDFGNDDGRLHQGKGSALTP